MNNRYCINDGYKQTHIQAHYVKEEEKPTHIHKQSVCCAASNVDLHCGRLHPTNWEVGHKLLFSACAIVSFCF